MGKRRKSLVIRSVSGRLGMSSRSFQKSEEDINCGGYAHVELTTKNTLYLFSKPGSMM